VNFANNLDPNIFTDPVSDLKSTTINWPKWGSAANRPILTFNDGLIPLSIASDNFRVEPIRFLADLSRQFP
jgi:hypothetical protein